MLRVRAIATIAFAFMAQACTLDFAQFLDGAATYDAGDVTFSDSGDPGCPNPQLLIALDRTSGTNLPGAVARYSVRTSTPRMCTPLGATDSFPSHFFVVTGLPDGNIAVAADPGPQIIDVARNLPTPYSRAPAPAGDPVDIVALRAPDGSIGVAVAYLDTSGSQIAVVKQSYGLDQSRLWYPSGADGGAMLPGPAVSLTLSPTSDLWALVPGTAAAYPIAPWGGSTTSTTIAEGGVSLTTVAASAGRVVWVGASGGATAVFYANASDTQVMGPTHCGGGVCGSQIYRHAIPLPAGNMIAAICDDTDMQRVVMWAPGAEDQCVSVTTTSTVGSVYTMRRLGVSF